MPSWVVWLSIALAVLGTVLNARKRWQGFVLWIVADVLLCLHNALLRDWAQAALWAVYLVIAVYGLAYWLRRDAIKMIPLSDEEMEFLDANASAQRLIVGMMGKWRGDVPSPRKGEA